MGECCLIGGTLGFVTRIGLRSLEMQTHECRITIPNSIVDEETIVNCSLRDGPPNDSVLHVFELHLPLPSDLSPDQLGDLLHSTRSHLHLMPGLSTSEALVDQNKDHEDLILRCSGNIHSPTWVTLSPCGNPS